MFEGNLVTMATKVVEGEKVVLNHLIRLVMTCGIKLASFARKKLMA
jgi:hypothetical protein